MKSFQTFTSVYCSQGYCTENPEASFHPLLSFWFKKFKIRKQVLPMSILGKNINAAAKEQNKLSHFFFQKCTHCFDCVIDWRLKVICLLVHKMWSYCMYVSIGMCSFFAIEIICSYGWVVCSSHSRHSSKSEWKRG